MSEEDRESFTDTDLADKQDDRAVEFLKEHNEKMMAGAMEELSSEVNDYPHTLLDTPAGLRRVALMAEQLLHKREAYEEQKEKAESLGAGVKEDEKAFIATLRAAGLDRFDLPGFTFSIREKSSVKIPKDAESKALFFAYLREQGIFDALVSVHSQTLNSWYNSEAEVALEKGVFEFRVPGIEPPTPYDNLSIRKRG